MNIKLLKALAVILLGVTTISKSYAADSDDQSNIVFEEGAVHIYCLQPSDGKLEYFIEAFPKLIENLQLHANEGRVIRAHYLKELKDGIFIVVGGDTRKVAVSNAAQLLEEQQAIINASIESLGGESIASASDNACRMLEVGPVAILPQ